jgi:hypothetical protein
VSRPYWDRLIGSNPAAEADAWIAFAEALRRAMALRPSLHGRDYVGDPDQYSVDLTDARLIWDRLLAAVEHAEILAWRWSDRRDGDPGGDPDETGPSVADERRWDSADDIARGGSGGEE